MHGTYIKIITPMFQAEDLETVALSGGSTHFLDL
jgi:hypothetical protein